MCHYIRAPRASIARSGSCSELGVGQAERPWSTSRLQDSPGNLRNFSLGWEYQWRASAILVPQSNYVVSRSSSVIGFSCIFTSRSSRSKASCHSRRSNYSAEFALHGGPQMNDLLCHFRTHAQRGLAVADAKLDDLLNNPADFYPVPSVTTFAIILEFFRSHSGSCTGQAKAAATALGQQRSYLLTWAVAQDEAWSTIARQLGGSDKTVILGLINGRLGIRVRALSLFKTVTVVGKPEKKVSPPSAQSKVKFFYYGDPRHDVYGRHGKSLIWLNPLTCRHGHSNDWAERGQFAISSSSLHRQLRYGSAAARSRK
jgi:hypothetical protein